MKTKILLSLFLVFSFWQVALTANVFVKHIGISKTNIDVTNPTVMGEITISPSTAGKVIVHFDGKCVSTPGDRIILAASSTTRWGVNDGSVAVKAKNAEVKKNSFSHTRVYNVDAGTHTFYALAQNYVEKDGDGIASIYGNLTVEFVPEGQYMVGFQRILKSHILVKTPTVFGKVTISPSTAGKVIVHFDGTCISTPGDRIILAASDTTKWKINDGSVSVEALSNDFKINPFSHTRVYDVDAGSHTFYAIVQNYVKTSGDGYASVYGSLTVEFVPEDKYIVGFAGISETHIDVTESKVLGEVSISPSTPGKAVVQFDGKCVSTPGDRIILAASDTTIWKPNDGNVSAQAFSKSINSNSFSHTRVYDVDAGTHKFYAIAQNYVKTNGDGIASIYGSLTVKFFPEGTASLTTDINNRFSIYPNPASNYLNINGLKGDANIYIYTISGKEVIQYKTNQSLPQLNISSLENGIYLIKLETNNKYLFMKFVKN